MKGHAGTCLVLAVILLVVPGEALAADGLLTPASVPGSGLVSYATCTTHTSTIIRWYPENVRFERLLYANESFYNRSGSYDNSLATGNISPGQGIFFTGLEAGVRYHYTLVSKETNTGDRSFMTFPENGSCTFVVYGDTREQAPYYTQLERHRIVADRIATESCISFVINTGDLVSNSGDDREWDRFFGSVKNLTGTTTYAAVRGNHDADRALFRDLYGAGGIYSFDCGGMHIAVLDSNNDASLSPVEQARWLADDLSAADTWKVVLLHHPLYTSEEKHFGGFSNLREAFEPALTAGNVSAVFNAHVHAYERIEQSGISYITEGRGGAPAYRLNETKAAGSLKSAENTLGYSRVTLDPEYETLSIDVITVAEISSDLRNVTRVYPDGILIERVVLTKTGYRDGEPEKTFRTVLAFPDLLCRNVEKPGGRNFSLRGFPFHICLVKNQESG